MEHVVAAGAGRMGRGIAQVMAYAGFEVTLLDLKPRTRAETEALRQAASTEIAAALDTFAQLGKLDQAQAAVILGRIRHAGHADTATVLASADVVFEGVPEVMETKAAVLAELSSLTSPETLLSSTTSTFSADTLADHVRHPERFVNAHWLNPAFLIPVVEVSPSSRTADESLARLRSLLHRAGKLPVVCAPTPGFIVPRIQALAMNEAARLVQDGVATAEDIDVATRYGFGVRFAVLGLLEFIDFGGCDILHNASAYLTDALPSDRHRAPPIIDDMMRSGRQGLRDGKGFHDYRDRDMDEYRRETITRLVGLLDHLGLVPTPDSAVHAPGRPGSTRVDP